MSPVELSSAFHISVYFHRLYAVCATNQRCCNAEGVNLMFDGIVNLQALM